jgi:hypothetical protein
MKRYRLTESKLRGMIKEAVKSALYEGAYDEWDDSYDDSYEDHTWYNEEDYDGNFGRPGMIRSYYTHTIYLDNAELDAQESGYDDVIEYLRYWASECLPDCPWYWIEQKSGYGHNGNTLFEDDNIVDGHLVCKEIYDQVMFDAYPPTDGASGAGAMSY